MGPSGDRHSPIVTSNTAVINQERYSERVVGKRQKVQAQEVAIASKPDAVSEFKEKQTAVRQTLPKDFSPLPEDRMPTSFSTIGPQHMSRGSGKQNGWAVVAPLEHTSGWGAQWQQGGTGAERQYFRYAPSYSQGAGERDLYVGNVRTTQPSFFANNSRRLSTGKVEDHTRPWGNNQPDLNLRQEIECKMDLSIGVRKAMQYKYETGKVDEWGNVRGQIQRAPPKDRIPGTDQHGRYLN